MIAQNTVIQDGQTYYPGQEIWDLGSIKAVAGLDGSVRHYEGKQKDFDKLPKYVSGGSTVFMVDSGRYYRFDEKTKTWNEPNKVTNRFVEADEVYSILNGKIQKLSEDVSEIGTPLVYKGSIATSDSLPLSPEIGWVYNIESESIYGASGMNVAWNGTLWDPLGPTFDLSLLLTKEESKKLFEEKVDKSQGTQNSGKIMGIDDDGNVALVLAPRAFYDESAHVIRFTGKAETGNIFGEVTREEKTAQDTSTILFPNRLYAFPEMKTLNISLTTPDSDEIANEYHFIFQSGTTATILTLPESIKSDMAVESNRIYEVSIVDNLLAWTSWAVTA